MYVVKIYFNVIWKIILDTAKKADTIARIKNARQRVRNEIQDLTDRLRITQENIKRARQRILENNPSIGTFNTLTHENIKREMVD
jgi:predicted  nucleic acid-binding Zn-ribbon protein